MRGDGGLASPNLLVGANNLGSVSPCAPTSSREHKCNSEKTVRESRLFRDCRSMAFTVREIESPDPVTRVAAEEAKLRETDHDIGEKMILNMGPSHPATHGVLRLVLELDGEIITKAMPDIGFLHRGDEKIAENMQYNQFVPYTDRLDYLAPLANNVAYALAVEKLMNWDIPPRGKAIRVICCET